MDAPMNGCCTAAFPAAMCRAHAKTDAELAITAHLAEDDGCCGQGCCR